MQELFDDVNREKEALRKKSKENSKNENHCNRTDECF